MSVLRDTGRTWRDSLQDVETQQKQPISQAQTKEEESTHQCRTGNQSLAIIVVSHDRGSELWRRTYMDDVAFSVNHDVPIVAILDLQDVADDRICGH